MESGSLYFVRDPNLHDNEVIDNFCKRVALLIRYVCVVKFMTVILSLFLLGLSIAPCSDVPESDNMEISFSTEGDHNHGEPEDLCPPLCVCHCCHSHLVINQIFLKELGTPTIAIHRSTYTDPISSGFFDSLLQPPQV